MDAEKLIKQLRQLYPQLLYSEEEVARMRSEAARYHTVQKIMFDALFSASREAR